MAIALSVINNYVDATMIRLHKCGFDAAFEAALLEYPLPRHVSLAELRSAVGKRLAELKKQKDPIQLSRAGAQSIVFVIAKKSEITFIPEGRHVRLFGVRWVGIGAKPPEVEVDGRMLTRAYRRAQEHFKNMRSKSKN